MRSWQTDDGLPNNNVTAIAEGPDGYLWVGTPVRLVRFDGFHFTPFSRTGPDGGDDKGASALWPSSTGDLWIRPSLGSLIKLNPELSTVDLTSAGLPQGTPLAATEDRQGSFWIAYPSAMCRIRNGQAVQFPIKGVLPGSVNCSLTCDRAGNLWISKGSRAGIIEDGQFRQLAAFPEHVVRVAAADTNGVWLAVGVHLFKCDPAGHLQDLGMFQAETARAEPWAMLVDHTGAVWIGTDGSGLFRHSDLGFEKIETSHPYILSLSEDREGNVWVGTAGGGLDRISRKGIQLEAGSSSLAAVQSICEDTNGVLWGATQTGLLVARTNGAWGQGFPDRPLGEVVMCVAADRNGAVWIGTRDRTLFCWQDNHLNSWTPKEGLMGHTIVALLAGSTGDLWIGEYGPPNSGVQCLHDGELETLKMPKSVGRITAFAEDAATNIWVGTAAGTVMQVKGDSLEKNPAITSSNRAILSLYATRDGALWIGYEGFGLGRLKDGKFSRVGTEQGLYDDHISQIIADDEGWFWFGCERGIFKVKGEELEAVLDGRVAQLRSIYYGRNEGLSSMEANSVNVAPYVSSRALCDRDGRLWIPMRTALAVVNPHVLREKPEPPPVLLTEVAVDGRVIASYGGTTKAPNITNLKLPGASLRLPPSHRRLELRFAAINFSAPDNVHIRYLLEGFDNDWVDAGTEREASYSRLVAGRYQFRLQACNGNGPWSTLPVALAFTVSPFFWQTWWFQAEGLILFTAVVIAVVRYISFRRLRAKLHVLEQRAALDREKARIARDLHDNLGCRLTKIMTLSRITLRDRETPAQISTHAMHIGETAKQIIDSLDETVWILNSHNDNFPNLINYIGQAAVEFLRTANIRARVDFPDHPRELPVSADVRHNLFLVVQEALNNIVRHAQATEVRMLLAENQKSFTLTIEDNGRGFEAAPAGGGADGLRNMRQRMEELKGEFQVESRPGAGTRITVTYHWPKPD